MIRHSVHEHERVFEALMRARRVPCIGVDEARKALLPEGGGPDGMDAGAGAASRWGAGVGAVGGAIGRGWGDRDGDGEGEGDGDRADAGVSALKSFDFVVYTRPSNLLIEVKGRSAGVLSRAGRGEGDAAERRGPVGRGKGGRRLGMPRLETWVTADDAESLGRWQGLFGSGFRAAFAFVYPLAEQPPDGLFQEIVPYKGAWYALLVAPLDGYAAHMRPRSGRWRTVDVATEDLVRLALPVGAGCATG